MHPFLKLVVVSLLAVLCAPAEAVELRWKSPVSGTFNSSASWQPTGTPGQSDTVIFDLSSAGYIATATGNASVGKFQIGNDTMTLSTWVFLLATELLQPAVQLGLETGDVANLTLQGNFGGRNIEIGSASGSQATVNVSSGDLTTSPYFNFSPGGEFVVGAAGKGTVNATGGGLSSDGHMTIGRDTSSEGAVTLNSSFAGLGIGLGGLTVGQSGKGSLVLSDRAKARVQGAVIIGQEADSVGSISLSDFGTAFSPPGASNGLITSTIIGKFGEGSFSVNNGAVATFSGALVLGEQVDSLGKIAVDGVNSSFTTGLNTQVTTLTTIGAAGSGSVSVTAGGAIKLRTHAVAARDAGSQADITLSGLNSILEARSLTLADSGSAELAIENGARATIDYLNIGSKNGSQGHVTVDGAGAVLVAGGVSVGIAGNGTLDINGGANATVPVVSYVGMNAGGVGSFTVDGPGSKLNFTLLTVGNSGTGSFDVKGGATAVSPNWLTLGANAGSSGTASVDGPSTLTVANINVGGAGTGLLNITGGGKFSTENPLVVGTNAGSSGKVNIQGAGSSLNASAGPEGVIVGSRGIGEISISGGGKLSVPTGEVILGDKAGSKGTLTVDGAGSSLAIGPSWPFSLPTLRVGEQGSGTLRVTGGANVSLGLLTAGSGPPNTSSGLVELIGPGTKMTITASGFEPSYIGQNSTGNLSIAAGATLNSSTMYVGYGSGALGSARVEGPGSSWTAIQPIYIGTNGGVGSLSILDSGLVSVPTRHLETGSKGTVEIDGGTLSAGVLNYGTIINNGSILGTVDNRGTLSGSGTISGKVTQWGGTLAPGNSPGTMPMGALDFNLGTFELEINSASGVAGGPIGWDLLSVAGAASFNGYAIVDVVSLVPDNTAGNVFDFNSLQNYQWTFLTAGGGIQGFNPNLFSVFTGNFDNPFDGSFFVSQSGNALVLNYVIPEPSSFLLALLGIAAFAIAKARQPRRAVW